MTTQQRIFGTVATAGIALGMMTLGCGSDAKTRPDATLSSDASVVADAAMVVDSLPPVVDAPVAVDVPAPLDADLQLDTPSDDAGVPVPDSSAPIPSRDGGAALPACASLVNPIYITTGDVHVPLLRQVGKLLRAQPNPTTLVWVTTDACSMVSAIYAGNKFTTNGSYIPADPAWDETAGSLPSCSVPSAGVPIDLATFCGDPSICGAGPTPNNLRLVTGPVQTFIYIVPSASIATAISAEEAYFVFGFGENGQVSPWTNPDFYFIRNPTAGVQIVLGLANGVPSAKWKGQRLKGMAPVSAAVASATAPDQAIGILGTETYDLASNRAVLRSLSFQARGQDLGYLPDSLPTSFDKRNVRDGHYVVSSHVFYLLPVDTAGTATNARVKSLVELFTGGPGAVSAGVDPISLVARNGLVPDCAMTVQRPSEGADLTPYAPADVCGCAFEAAVGKAPASCIACTTDSQCTGARCMHGYCESADGRTSLSDCAAPSADYASILNNSCTGRSTSPKRPVPKLQQANGGNLPPLP